MVDWDDIFNHTLTSSNLKVKKLWDDAYLLIYLLNNVIISADQILPTGEGKDQITGQALVIRSHLYLTLAEWFQNIPIETAIEGANSSSAQKSEVFDLIKAD